MGTPQSAILPETGPHGLFLTLHLDGGVAADRAIKQAAATLPALLDELGAQDPAARLVGSLGFGAQLWSRLGPQPEGLGEFTPLGSGKLQAPATGGDLLLHLHSARRDLNYQAAYQFLQPLRPFVQQAEEVHGFRYLDARDLTGFIDGTENPEGNADRAAAALIGDEAPGFAGGSFVLAQRYVHRIAQWEPLSQQEQESIIGRTKPDSVELADEVRPATAHISRVVIEEEGEELEIVRHSLPYGTASGEAGLVFVAYSRDRSVFDKMLARMFGISGDGISDRLMEFTSPVTGAYFFAPSLEMLRGLGR